MKSRVHLYALLVCLAVCGVGCNYIGRRTNKPSETVKAFYEHVEAGNVDEAAKLMSKNGMFESMGGMEGFRKYVAKDSEYFRQMGGIESITINKERIFGEGAEVDVILKLRKDEKPLRPDFTLVWGPKDTSWEIAGWRY
ncbi:MAG TPA: hypothetical protein VF553_02560 [Pyrinomonadaceae bacterium]|jgi:hypothetical protein